MSIPIMVKYQSCRGFGATGKSLEECRQNLCEVVDGWVLVRLSRGLTIPAIGKTQIRLPQEMEVV